MTFSHTLDEQRQLSPVEWGPFFLDYNVLKKKIKGTARVHQEGHHTRSATTPTALASSQREVEFFRLMDHEMVRGAKFLTLTEGQCALRTRCVIIDGYRSTRHLLQSPTLGLDGIISGDTATGMWIRLMHACINVYKELLLLNHWVVLSYCGFSKILEKHDRWTGFVTKDKYLRFVVAKQHFLSYPRLHSMLRDMEALYAHISKLVPDGPERAEGHAKMSAVKGGIAGTAAEFATQTEELTLAIEDFYHESAPGHDGRARSSNNDKGSSSSSSSSGVTGAGGVNRNSRPPLGNDESGAGNRCRAAGGTIDCSSAARQAATVAAVAAKAAAGKNESGAAAAVVRSSPHPGNGARGENEDGEPPLAPSESKRCRISIERSPAEIGYRRVTEFPLDAAAAAAATGPELWSPPPNVSSSIRGPRDWDGAASRGNSGFIGRGAASGNMALERKDGGDARETAVAAGGAAGSGPAGFVVARTNRPFKVRVSWCGARLPEGEAGGVGYRGRAMMGAAEATSSTAAGYQVAGAGNVVTAGSAGAREHDVGRESDRRN
ncbi:unnamed protein product [Scytosiphon promiscuus]